MQEPERSLSPNVSPVGQSLEQNSPKFTQQQLREAIVQKYLHFDSEHLAMALALLDAGDAGLSLAELSRVGKADDQPSFGRYYERCVKGAEADPTRDIGKKARGNAKRSFQKFLLGAETTVGLIPFVHKISNGIWGAYFGHTWAASASRVRLIPVDKATTDLIPTRSSQGRLGELPPTLIPCKTISLKMKSPGSKREKDSKKGQGKKEEKKPTPIAEKLITVTEFQLASRGGKLRILCPRVDSLYSLPQHFGKGTSGITAGERLSFTAWAMQAGDLKTQEFFPQRDPDSERSSNVSSKSDETTRYSGQCWGVCRADLLGGHFHNQMLVLTVCRIEFREHQAVTSPRNFVATSYRPTQRKRNDPTVAVWLKEKWNFNRQTNDLLPHHSILKISVLVEVKDGSTRKLILSHRIDVTKTGKNKNAEFVSATVIGHATSERVSDDDRGPDLRIQVGRLLKQVGLDLGNAEVEWLGYSKEEFSVTIHAFVQIKAKFADIFAAFDRRSARQKIRQIAMIEQQRAIDWLAAGQQAGIATNPGGTLFMGTRGFADGILISRDLTTTLALWAIWIGRAEIKDV